MLWSKLKNVILALLLLTNLFLLALVLSETVEGGGYEQEARETALDFLEERGIYTAEGIVPKSFELKSQQLNWDRSEEAQQAKAFLGDVETESLGGDIIRYWNENGELRFHGNGEFYGSFHTPVFVVEGETLEEHGRRYLGLLGLTVTLLDVEEENGRSTLRFVQTMDEVLLLGCEIHLVYENDILWEVSQGKRLSGEYLLRDEENMTVATALIAFYRGLSELEQSCGEIFSVEETYLVITPLSSAVLLTPAWRILAESGEYYLNGVTGGLEQRF